MRPPILAKYPIDQIVSNLKKSKEKETWIVRFIPQLLSKEKINANAISLMKRISLLKLEPITNDELNKVRIFQKGPDDEAKSELVLVKKTGNIRLEKFQMLKKERELVFKQNAKGHPAREPRSQFLVDFGFWETPRGHSEALQREIPALKSNTNPLKADKVFQM